MKSESKQRAQLRKSMTLKPLCQVTLDSELGCSWHCVVGETFGFSLDLEEGAMLYLFYGSLAILVWKCGTQLLRETRWALHTCTELS